MVKVKIKSRKEKKFKSKSWMIFFIVVLLLFFVASTYYNLSNNSSQYVEQYGLCKNVTVGNCPSPAAGVFVPNGSSTEWTDFLNNAPTCVTIYTNDTDSDGYATTQCTTGTDCMDNNSNVNPGQTSYFTTDRGDGSFDYNCDGSETKEDTNTCEGVGYGWVVGPPACGNSGDWCLDVDGCVHGCSTHTQACH